MVIYAPNRLYLWKPGFFRGDSIISLVAAGELSTRFLRNHFCPHVRFTRDEISNGSSTGFQSASRSPPISTRDSTTSPPGTQFSGVPAKSHRHTREHAPQGLRHLSFYRGTTDFEPVERHSQESERSHPTKEADRKNRQRPIDNQQSDPRALCYGDHDSGHG